MSQIFMASNERVQQAAECPKTIHLDEYNWFRVEIILIEVVYNGSEKK